MKKTVLIAASVMLMTMANSVWAHGDGEHGTGHNPCAMQMKHGDGDMSMMKGGFKKQTNIDGFDVTFYIMKAMKGMDHGGSHNVMIKVEKEGKVLTNIAVNSKVTHPNDTSESKMMMKMGDWYMAVYDLNHPGKHQVMVLFKTHDGAKHFGGIDFLATGQ